MGLTALYNANKNSLAYRTLWEKSRKYVYPDYRNSTYFSTVLSLTVFD